MASLYQTLLTTMAYVVAILMAGPRITGSLPHFCLHLAVSLATSVRPPLHLEWYWVFHCMFIPDAHSKAKSWKQDDQLT